MYLKDCLRKIKLFKLRQLRQSFSLMEMSVALAVAGITTSAGVMAYRSTNPDVKSDIKKLAKIQEALNKFFVVNGRLPFPANPDNGFSHNLYLKENSSSFVFQTEALDVDGNKNTDKPNNKIIWGIVPVRSLGLTDDYAYDSKGHNFEYITHDALAKPNGSAIGNWKKANYVTNQNGKYEVFYQAQTKDVNNISLTLQKLQLASAKTSEINEDVNDNIAYFLIGKNKTSCFFNAKTLVKGQQLPNDKTKNNCVFYYQDQTLSNIVIYQGFSKSHDNLVSFQTMSDLSSVSYKAQDAMANSNSSTANYYNALPVGSMILFYLNENQIPNGWQVCNGENGTPDMRGVVAVGVGKNGENDNAKTEYMLGISGGTERSIHMHQIILTPQSIPNHYHYLAGSHSHSISLKTTYGGWHKHIVPFGEHRDYKDYNRFGTLSSVYNNSNQLVTLSSNSKHGFSGGNYDQDNADSLTSMPIYTDERVGSVYAEIISGNKSSSIYANVSLNSDENNGAGQHRHTVSGNTASQSINNYTNGTTYYKDSAGSYVANGESIVIRTNELYDNDVDVRQPYKAVYYICKIK